MAKFKHSITAGGVVVGKNRKVIVVNQNGNSWSLPKGKIDPGEDALMAAKREIAEESGVKQLRLIKELGSYERYRIGKDGGENKNDLKTIHLFLFTTEQHDLQPTDPDNPEARWVDINDVVTLLTHQKDREYFEQIKPEIQALPECSDTEIQ